MDGPFWRERLDTVLNTTIPSQHVQLVEYGILDFARSCRSRCRRSASRAGTTACRPRCSGTPTSASGSRRRAMRSATAATRTIEAQIDAIVDDLERAQAPDGYLNCWYLGREPDKRWTNLRDRHELYCAGHMLEGAIAYYQATGRRKLLDIMLRYVDHIATVLRAGRGPEARLLRPPGDRAGAGQALSPDSATGSTSTSPPISSTSAGAAAALFRRRGGGARRRSRRSTGSRPTNTASRTSRSASRTRSSATPCARCTSTPPWPTSPPSLDDEALKRACEVLWNDVTSKRMYVTAGLGPSASNEGFTDGLRPAERHRLCRDLRLGGADLLGAAHAQPRLRRHVCRRHGAGALQRRALRPLARRHALFLREPARERRHAHALGMAHLPVLHDERVAAGRLGRRLFLFDRRRRDRRPSLWRQHREARSRRDARSRSARRPTIPGRARSGIAVDPESPATFALKLRIPGWATSATMRRQRRAGRYVAKRTSGYVEIRANGRPGDAVELDLPMPAERLYAHPGRASDVGRVAIRAGRSSTAPSRPTTATTR